ncbi:hypothetical protein GII33_14160 [Gordonia pseudamarae]|uniref:VRR-NUC domain-containing protein n=1 Tax=Gordonia pseudamarae TaxID=2831662 RepID=A0ABX6IIU8_9ACTN|nr:hypothetical protein [Gordonia pseudamarae]QHN26928.1 hypothetical protein GII33_14160 [Gordonia pseudamarae]QHN35817.1 hypothetical protein GII31_13985 [Gordonia pseudamarae]
MAPESSPDRHFLPKEKVAADWLRDTGNHRIISVERDNDIRRPDSILHDGVGWIPAEIKTLDSASQAAMARNLAWAFHGNSVSLTKNGALTWDD